MSNLDSPSAMDSVPQDATTPHESSEAFTAPDPGLTLCLSGGGFRATPFHLLALRRLNELGVLSQVKVVTGVSGGSILNGILATRWGSLSAARNTLGAFTNFDSLIAEDAHKFCALDLRTRLLMNEPRLSELLIGRAGVSAATLAEAYEWLFTIRGSIHSQIHAPAHHVLSSAPQICRLVHVGTSTVDQSHVWAMIIPDTSTSVTCPSLRPSPQGAPLDFGESCFSA